jgi:hypothetical protein
VSLRCTDEEGKKRSKVLEAYTKFYLKPSGEQFEDRNRCGWLSALSPSRC